MDYIYLSLANMEITANNSGATTICQRWFSTNVSQEQSFCSQY